MNIIRNLSFFNAEYVLALFLSDGRKFVYVYRTV